MPVPSCSSCRASPSSRRMFCSSSQSYVSFPSRFYIFCKSKKAHLQSLHALITDRSVLRGQDPPCGQRFLDNFHTNLSFRFGLSNIIHFHQLSLEHYAFRSSSSRIRNAPARTNTAQTWRKGKTEANTRITQDKQHNNSAVARPTSKKTREPPKSSATKSNPRALKFLFPPVQSASLSRLQEGRAHQAQTRTLPQPQNEAAHTHHHYQHADADMPADDADDDGDDAVEDGVQSRNLDAEASWGWKMQARQSVQTCLY